MEKYFFYILVIFLILVLWETVKYRLHLIRRKKISTVINVNGTRGKSSVTRLLCFALREAGFKVMAKTTGTVPQILAVSGEVKNIERGAYPNINEQLMVVHEASSEGADILVIECMAVDPNYQKVVEEKMLRSDIGIITNVRNDHREVMGATKEQIAEALCNTIPRGKVVFASGGDGFGVIKKNTEKKRSRLIRYRPAESLTDELMKPFPFLEQRENVALVLDVCKYLGVDQETALRGMYKTIPDPGALTSIKLDWEGKWFEFVNAFSTNDPDSLAMIWRRMSRKFQAGQKNFFLFNSRMDRPYRSVDTASVFSTFPIDLFLITGDGTGLFHRALLKSGVPKGKIRLLGMRGAESIFKTCIDKAAEKNFVFCGGNIKGRGLEMINYLEGMGSLSK